MTSKLQQPISSPSDVLAVLARELHVRLINCSSSGCLVETDARLEVGTVGSLRLTLDGVEFVDDMQVVRCQPLEGAGATYLVGARFLWTAAPGSHSLRRAMTPEALARKLAVES